MSLPITTGRRDLSGALRKLARASMVLFAAYFLAGCASTLSARVTRFEKWPADAVGATYRLVRGAGQSDDLEYQAFADNIRAAIGPVGLVEARQGQAARFDVSFSYGVKKGVEWVTRYADFPPYGPWGPWGYYGPFGPPLVNTPVTVFRNELAVVIKDRTRNDAEVYRSSAVTDTPNRNLPQVMPYLARAVFDHFPGNNGQVITVRYKLEDQ
jgi:hypothetical protein